MKVTQSSCFLKDIVRQAQDGSLLPAAFQRPYVWGKRDVLALIESIMRGYPVGSLLLWTPWGAADLTKVSRGRLGPVSGSNSLADSLLLDGQNRLASVAFMGHNFDKGFPSDMTEIEKQTWQDGTRLVVDLGARQFLFVPEAEVGKGLYFPLFAVINGALTNSFARKYWDTEWASLAESERNDAVRYLDACTDAFSNARVTVTDIAHATVEEAKDAFLHICRVGVPMSEADFNECTAWVSSSN